MKEQITLRLIIFAIIMGFLASIIAIAITTPKHNKSSSSSKTRDKTPYSQANAEPYADKLEEMQYIFDNINLSNFKINNSIK